MSKILSTFLNQFNSILLHMQPVFSVKFNTQIIQILTILLNNNLIISYLVTKNNTILIYPYYNDYFSILKKIDYFKYSLNYKKFIKQSFWKKYDYILLNSNTQGYYLINNNGLNHINNDIVIGGFILNTKGLKMRRGHKPVKNFRRSHLQTI